MCPGVRNASRPFLQNLGHTPNRPLCSACSPLERTPAQGLDSHNPRRSQRAKSLPVWDLCCRRGRRRTRPDRCRVFDILADILGLALLSRSSRCRICIPPEMREARREPRVCSRWDASRIHNLYRPGMLRQVKNRNALQAFRHNLRRTSSYRASSRTPPESHRWRCTSPGCSSTHLVESAGRSHRRCPVGTVP